MTAARDYAKALFMLTEELGTTETALADVGASETAFRTNPSYVTLTDTPALSPEVKLSVDESVGNLIKILCERHSVYLFPEIAREYRAIYNESRGICTAEAISATPLTEKQKEAISRKLAAMTGKTIILKNTTDPEVLGGLKLRYMGTQLDGTLRARLDAIESGIKKTIL